MVVVFLHQLDSFDWITPPYQIFEFRDGVVRRVVQCSHRDKHRCANEFALYNEIETGLLDSIVNICGAMPRVGRGGVDHRLLVSVGGVPDGIMKPARLIHLTKI